MNREIRIAGVIKKEISHIIQAKVHDNRIGFVSVTNVEVTKDLSYAKVYISTYGTDEDRKKAIAGLKHAKGFIKRELAQILQIRQMPDLTFIDDRSIEHGVEMIGKLKYLDHAREDLTSDDKR
ncbi:MAG: 30S ribosome-binding factor RbfA [Candidatus Margulisiibacteriota bacterium]|nr:MAG: 30S ribosome-binding factor RbfA [Candidatus Margulisiibacteriota bacterium]HAR62261.1 30S ribosome-binding factor RbfA [Candidatus Margulisiibacteriota bacterium]HCT86434.1 30S ribosome-binding factor RbfA [Candidatus Margulisiibacteriota bacterium]HCY35566.1 30S ribosome-binding factor RbfA [Candidatus Margulisiibacteriota bacterium]